MVLGECAIAGVVASRFLDHGDRRQVVVDIRFAIRGKEEHPILLDAAAGLGWIAGELGEERVGFQGTERKTIGRRGE